MDGTPAESTPPASRRSAALRESREAELAALKLGALQKKAIVEGVDAETIAEALDSDYPRRTLIAAIMDAMGHEIAAVGSALEATSAAREKLRAELLMLKLGALQQKAAAEGADADAVAQALDADDPKVAVIDLLIERMVPQLDASALAAAGAADARRKEQLDAARAELCMLTLGTLHKKAIAEGVGDEMIVHALDADDPKAAVIELLVQLIAQESGGKNSAAVETASEAQAAAAEAAEVQRVKELTAELSALGLGALQKRATTEGLDTGAIDDALDTAAPKLALVKAIIAVSSNVVPDPATTHETYAGKTFNKPVEKLRRELATLKTSELLHRARAAGVAQDDLDQAADSDDHHEALIELVTGFEACALDGSDQLRTELEGLKISQLLQRARAQGVGQDALDEAADGDDQKGALVSLVLEASMSPGLSLKQAKIAAESANKAEEKLRAELVSLKTSELLKRARAAGIDQAAMDRAADSADQKQVLISLVLEAKMDDEQPPSTGPKLTPQPKPHFGASQGVSATRSGSFTVMLSYEWSSQPLVIEVRKALQAHGVTCWMDVDGGMKRDIFDSMAEGVQCCTTIVPFMTQAYQNSENCKLELKFARQLGKPIIPVLTQEGWQATGWLGILTAGALWTPIFDVSAVQDNIDKLISQLALTVDEGITNIEAGDEPEEELSEVKHELQRFLRREQPANMASNLMGAAAPEARLPAEVPEPPPFMMITLDMEETKAYLKRQLGGSCEAIVVIGMGGIGKTTYCSWLCHQQDVLGNFETVVWVTLGQEPDLRRILQLVYLQLEPQGLLPPTLSMDLVKEFVKQAMAEKRLLVVVDDGWSKSELHQLLALVDRKTDSKVLVSSRLHGLCDDFPIAATEIEAQLPSMDDAVRLLLGSAGLPDVKPPAEAKLIVEQCSHLPLALGMCGKILKGLSLGADDSWQGVLDIIHEAMRESQEQQTIEESVILASLKNVPTDAKLMFYALGLCAEDAALPLEMLVVFFEATKQALGRSPADKAEPHRPISIMYARRLVKQLLDRSLVLGKVDCVSLHDLVRDHAQGKMDERQKIAAHKAIVEHFIRTRPNRVQGWLHAEHSLTDYVATHAQYHIRCGWEGLTNTGDGTTWQSDTVAVRWFTAGNVGFIDPIIHACGMALGVTRCSELARQHSEAHEFWEAAVCWAVVARTMWGAGMLRSQELYEVLKACVEACNGVPAANSDEEVEVPTEQRDRLQLSAVIKLVQSWDLEVQQSVLPNLMRLAPMPVAREDPLTSFLVIFMAEAIPPWFAGDPAGFGASINKMYKLSTDVAFRGGEDWCADGHVLQLDTRTRDLMAVCSLGYPNCLSHWELLLEAENYDWRLFGPKGDGDYLKRAEAAYSFDSQHSSIAELCGFDVGYFPSAGWLTGLHWGDLEYARESCRRTVLNIVRGRSEAGDPTMMAVDEAMCVDMYQGTSWFLFCLDLREEAATIIAGTPFDLAGVESGPDDDDANNPGTTSSISKFFRDNSMVMHNPSGFTNCYRLMHVLLADPITSAEQERVGALLALIPESPLELAMMGVPAICPMPTLCYHSGLSACPLAAFVYAKLGQLGKAEAYANEAMLGDPARGGDTLPSTRIFSLIVLGMAQSERGDIDDADASFSNAVGVAEQTGELLYAAFGCFCWQRAVGAAKGGSDGDETRAAMATKHWLAVTSSMASSQAQLRALCEVVWRPLDIHQNPA